MFRLSAAERRLALTSFAVEVEMAAALRPPREGVPALPDQLCGDGFCGDSAAEASLGPLKQPIASQRRSDQAQCSSMMKRLFQVSAPEFASKQVECSGCSGDALLLALKDEQIDGWKVNRKSPNGRDWFFDVTISGASREFKVQTL